MPPEKPFSQEAEFLSKLDEEIAERREDTAPSAHIAKLREKSEVSENKHDSNQEVDNSEVRDEYPSEKRKRERDETMDKVNKWLDEFAQKHNLKRNKK